MTQTSAGRARRVTWVLSALLGWQATLVARIILGTIFVFSGAVKVTDIGQFQANVEAYRLLPVTVAPSFAIAVAWAEVLVGIYLLAGLFLRVTAAATAGLLAMFAAAITHNLLTGNVDHSCGCLPTTGVLASMPGLVWVFGGTTLTPFDVARDVVFIGLTAIIFWGNRSAYSLDGLLFSQHAPGAAELDGEDSPAPDPPPPHRWPA